MSKIKVDISFAESVIKEEGKAVLGLLELVRQPAFEQVVRLFLECSGSVIVSGMGKAGIVGNKISATLASTGTASHFLHPAEAVHGDLGRIQTNDIVLALSHSGESEEIVRLIEPLKQREIKLISVVGDPQSRLAIHSDIALCMGTLVEACPLGVAPSVSTTCILALGDALALTIMKSRQFGAEDYARFHPGGALGRKLLTVGQTMWFRPDEDQKRDNKTPGRCDGDRCRWEIGRYHHRCGYKAFVGERGSRDFFGEMFRPDDAGLQAGGRRHTGR
jgi:arabinose-5-phosphate isomerase